MSVLPTYFIPHGGGPWPFMDMPPNETAEHERLATFLRNLIADVGERPRAILVISAHWETQTSRVMSGKSNSMLYDYGGFPANTYELRYPAPGAPDVAKRVQELFEAAGLPIEKDSSRGLDHGTFIPFMLVAPDAKIPVIQLSLVRGLDPARHIAIGRAIAPLREEGVLIVGSGMSYHNMREFFNPTGTSEARGSTAFDTWLTNAVTSDPQTRTQRLTNWTTGESAREAHPREEHLLPLMVVAGAAANDPGKHVFTGKLFNAQVSGYKFG